MLTEVADGIWVRQSEWVWTNSIVVRGDAGLVVVDPGVHGADPATLAAEVGRLGEPVVAGFSTHPHFDHLLWHEGLGDVPRYATATGAEIADANRGRAREAAAEEAEGVPLDLVADVTPLPADGGPVPGEVIEHRAHSMGHAALLLADRRVLLAGDMLSDVLVPLFDFRQEDQLGAYEVATRAPGGGGGRGRRDGPPARLGCRGSRDRRPPRPRPRLHRRAATRRGTGQPRLEQDWLRDGPHQGNLKRARG